MITHAPLMSVQPQCGILPVACVTIRPQSTSVSAEIAEMPGAEFLKPQFVRCQPVVKGKYILKAYIVSPLEQEWTQELPLGGHRPQVHSIPHLVGRYEA